MDQANHEAMAGFFLQIAESLAEFLDRNLRALGGADWWNRRVLPTLRPKERANLERRGYTSLRQLDLASLLSALEGNWRDIARHAKLDWEAQNYVKELRSARNRWAHFAVEPPSFDDTFRDLDTMERFLVAIGADSAVLKRVRAEKKRIRQLVPQPPRLPKPPDPPRPDRKGGTFLLRLGATYYHKGFFNVGLAFEHHVRQDDGPVALRLGSDGMVPGRVSRRANLNGAPRVFGRKALRDWFQANYALGDTVEVRFPAPDVIALGG